MAKFKQISFNGSIIIDTNGKISYNAIKNVPAGVVDTSNHNHDAMYSSKASIEDRFTTTMNIVQEITKSLTSRPLKTKGYLNGGYKGATGTEYKRIQRFNMTTETGSDLGRISTYTGFYSPGSTSEQVGFFHDYSNKTLSDCITYATETTAVVPGNATCNTYGTLYDLYQQTKVFLNGSDGPSWCLLNPATKAYSALPNATSLNTGRQMLSSATFGYGGGSAGSNSYKYVYATGTSSAVTAAGGGGWQMVGVSRNKDVGYWIGYTDANHRVNMVTDVTTKINAFTINFSESNAVGGDTAGYLMGGYSYGAYGQHGEVQKMIWTTEVAQSIIGGKLAYEQSSAACAEA